MTIAIGDRLPDTVFVRMGANGPERIATADLFAGRTVALFSVPGAFTPTCSAKHLPGFIERADEILAKGVDEIVCTAVNDAFVMSAWGKAAGVGDKVTMLADGNGDFVRALGLEMDATKNGMGVRGRRFSMLVRDGAVAQLNVEAPGEYRVSTADHLIGQLA
ncbi:MAG: ahpC/TSA family protein [Rhizorhabdus sp.]|nr:ahpC/TSA family protein [Rhizorhabdus sp.]